ncbi:hypothetical protein ACLTEW_21515 [Gordonia lacunae]|uniref:hypothetical protein n=1 Tax=Gordonia lacunae TaxID=417102 RepID=UPI0039E5F24C
MNSSARSGSTPDNSTSTTSRSRAGEIWAWMYVLAAPVVAFITVSAAVASTTGGGDFCDPSYSSAAERDADFRVASLGIIIPSSIALAVGAVLLATLVSSRRRSGRGRTIRMGLAVTAVVLAMVGYVLLLVIADFTTDCG